MVETAVSPTQAQISQAEASALGIVRTGDIVGVRDGSFLVRFKRLRAGASPLTTELIRSRVTIIDPSQQKIEQIRSVVGEQQQIATGRLVGGQIEQERQRIIESGEFKTLPAGAGQEAQVFQSPETGTVLLGSRRVQEAPDRATVEQFRVARPTGLAEEVIRTGKQPEEAIEDELFSLGGFGSGLVREVVVEDSKLEAVEVPQFIAGAGLAVVGGFGRAGAESIFGIQEIIKDPIGTTVRAPETFAREFERDPLQATGGLAFALGTAKVLPPVKVPSFASIRTGLGAVGTRIKSPFVGVKVGTQFERGVPKGFSIIQEKPAIVKAPVGFEATALEKIVFETRGTTLARAKLPKDTPLTPRLRGKLSEVDVGQELLRSQDVFELAERTKPIGRTQLELQQIQRGLDVGERITSGVETTRAVSRKVRLAERPDIPEFLEFESKALRGDIEIDIFRNINQELVGKGVTTLRRKEFLPVTPKDQATFLRGVRGRGGTIDSFNKFLGEFETIKTGDLQKAFLQQDPIDVSVILGERPQQLLKRPTKVTKPKREVFVGAREIIEAPDVFETGFGRPTPQQLDLVFGADVPSGFRSPLLIPRDIKIAPSIITQPTRRGRAEEIIIPSISPTRALPRIDTGLERFAGRTDIFDLNIQAPIIDTGLAQDPITDIGQDVFQPTKPITRQSQRQAQRQAQKQVQRSQADLISDIGFRETARPFRLPFAPEREIKGRRPRERDIFLPPTQFQPSLAGIEIGATISRKQIPRFVSGIGIRPIPFDNFKPSKRQAPSRPFDRTRQLRKDITDTAVFLGGTARAPIPNFRARRRIPTFGAFGKPSMGRRRKVTTTIRRKAPRRKRSGRFDISKFL